MKLLIASDIHGSAYYCRKLLEAWEKEEAERMLLLEIFSIMVPEMTFRRNMPPGKSYPCSMQRKIASILSAATVRLRSTRWSWSSRSWRTIVCCLWETR